MADLDKKAPACVEEIAKMLLKLKPEQILGLARFLSVKTLTTEVDPETKKVIPRDGGDILADIVMAVADLPRNSRRWLLQYIRKELNKNGTSTSNK